jgi:hypothetical protein
MQIAIAEMNRSINEPRPYGKKFQQQLGQLYYFPMAKLKRNFLESTNTKQLIYLSVISKVDELSKHLSSQKNVDPVLSGSKFTFSTLKAGIIVGSGSASFEIIRDLVKKLSVLITMRFNKIEQNQALLSWKNAQTRNIFSKGISKFIELPVNGYLKDICGIKVENSNVALDKIWAFGGKTD